MGMLSRAPRPQAMTLRVLSLLLNYPSSEWLAHRTEFVDALRQEGALTADRQQEIRALLERLARRPLMESEADYVECFDRGRSTSLLLFEHVHGDARERGPAMIDLLQTYEKAGLYLTPDQMPDHLGVLLEFASTQPPTESRQFLQEFAHIVRAIFSALLKRQSPYACVLGAVLELAGEKAEPVAIAPEPALDETWSEPPVFGGCSTAGQSRPDPQPIRFIPSRSSRSTGASS